MVHNHIEYGGHETDHSSLFDLTRIQANMITGDKQANQPPTPPNSMRQLPPHKTKKRPLGLQLSSELNEQTSQTTTDMSQREEKKQKKDSYPIVVSYQPQFDLPSVKDEYRIVQEPDPDEVSIAEVLTHLGR